MKWANIFLLLFVAQYGISQQAIRGKITDATTQNAISGATVQIKDSSKGTTTDDNGIFVLPPTPFPVELIISYIGYETQSLIIEAPVADLLQIALTPSVTLLEEIIVSSESEEITLSEFKEYSVKDFEIIDSQLIWIEYHGTFDADILTLSDLDGQALNNLDLKDINQIEGLFKSCNNQVYLLTKYWGYPITIEETALSLGQAISIDTLDAYIKPCKAQDQDWLYYVF
ncbi:MAG: carboxypeptidase-like regulatory domain-containing protein, partial [Bacteroidota bacterium]